MFVLTTLHLAAAAAATAPWFDSGSGPIRFGHQPQNTDEHLAYRIGQPPTDRLASSATDRGQCAVFGGQDLGQVVCQPEVGISRDKVLVICSAVRVTAIAIFVVST